MEARTFIGNKDQKENAFLLVKHGTFTFLLCVMQVINFFNVSLIAMQFYMHKMEEYLPLGGDHGETRKKQEKAFWDG